MVRKRTHHFCALSIIPLLLFCTIIFSCKKDDGEGASLEIPIFEESITGSLEGSPITEASGIAASTKNPSYYWIHNDSGDLPRLFLIDSTGGIKSIIHLQNLQNRDWEDIDTYKDPSNGKSYIYIADIGDNFSQFLYKYIYRFEEPAVGSQGEIIITEVEKISVEYADGSKDAETLLIDPVNGEMCIVSKWEKKVGIYIIPASSKWGDSVLLHKKAELPISQIVAGSISPNSDQILLKSYDKIFYWRKEKNTSIFFTLIQPFTEIKDVMQPQEEAICWSRNNKDFYTANECIEGKDCKITLHKRK